MEIGPSTEAGAGTYLACRRCGQTVVASSAQYDVFEQMHYVCFHYEFEHDGDPDVECGAGGCPASGMSVPAARLRVSGVDLAQAGNTVAPAILAMEALGYIVTQEGRRLIARAGDARFSAEDPVAVLGLIKLAETRRPWRASDSEISYTMSRFSL